MKLQTTLLRPPTTCMVVLAALAWVLPENAVATPTIAFKTRATPIPGMPGTGDILGAGTAIQAEGTISGSEYGGAPAPLVGINFFAPAGTQLHPQGFATCAPSALQANGPATCPKRSIASAMGSATGVVTFSGERVPETASVQMFFAPGGGLVAFIDGVTPVLIEMIATVRVTSAAPPYGLEFSAQIPLIESVPGALDASAVEGKLEFGAAYKQGNKTISYLTLPKRCPRGGWPEKVQVSFLGGASAEASRRMPCPHR